MRIDGVLRADGPLGAVIVGGHGPEVVVTLQGTAPRPSRRQLGAIARFARERDLLIKVRDARGRPLAELGGSTSSLIGRVLVGTAAIRPRLRAIGGIRPSRA